MINETFDKLAKLYYETELLNFAMEYYSFYEAYCDSNGGRYSEKGIIALIKEASEAIASGDDDVLSKLYDMRKTIIAKMEIVSAYTERFSNYEYVVSRMELAPAAGTSLKDANDDELTKKLLTAVFAPTDNAAINLNIESMLAQLPVRMTKSKFYDLVTGALKSYIGTDKEYVDRYLYLLRSAAGIYEPAGIKESFKEFAGYEEELKKLLDADSAEADIDRMFEIIEAATEELNVITDEYIELQVLINHLCVVFETKKYTGEDGKGELIELISAVNTAYEEGDMEPLSEEWLDVFGKFEGMLEKTGFDIQKLKSKFEKELSKEADSAETEEYERILDACDELTSDSVFATPETDEAKCMETADEAYVEAVAEVFIKELDEAFANDKKRLVRARMAAVLGSLPVFFNSRTEVMNYIKNVLENCRDKAEKLMSVKLALEGIAGEE